MKNSITNRTNRASRACAAFLLVVFAVLIIAPLAVAATDGEDASLPMCCRTHGKHHCSMRMGGMNAATPNGNEQTLTTVSEKCPCTPSAPTTVHSDTFQPSHQGRLLTELADLPAVHAQHETKWHIAFDRSRQKRGPPLEFLPY